MQNNVEILLKGLKKSENLEAEPIIHKLVATGNSTKLAALLKMNPACIHEENSFKETPLHIALKNHRLEELRLLLTAKPSLTVRDTLGTTPLHIAVCFEDISLLQLLLNSKLPLDLEILNGTNATPLVVAASKKNIKAVELLLQNGANVDAVNAQEHSALSYAITKNNLDMVRLLLTWGAKINLPPKLSEINPQILKLIKIFHAIRTEKKSLVKLLKLFNDDVFPSLKQLAGFVVSQDQNLKKQVITCNNEIKDFIKYDLPKKTKLLPRTNFYNFIHSSDQECKQGELKDWIEKTLALLNSPRLISSPIPAHACDELENAFNEYTTTSTRLITVKQIYTDVKNALEKTSEPIANLSYKS